MKDIVQRTAELSNECRANVSVHASGTHSLTFDLHPGTGYASIYLTLQRSDLKAITSLLVGILAETESFADESAKESVR